MAYDVPVPGPPLVAEHDTWVSLDPVVGCPAACDYCYLGQMDLRLTRPRELVSPAEAISRLADHLGTRRDHTPVAIGNYTDMAMTPRNRRYLTEFAHEFSDRFPDRPLVVITKSPKIVDVLDELEATGHPVAIFLSHSYSAGTSLSIEKGNVATRTEFLESISAISGRRNLHAIHFWRPFIDRLNPPDSLAERVSELRGAGASASVVVGFKTSAVEEQWWSTSTPALLTDRDDRRAGNEFFPSERWRELSQIASAQAYPVYRNSSCALAHALGVPDALRSYEGPESPHHCVSTSCLPVQRTRCGQDALRPVEADAVERALSLLPIEAVRHGWALDAGHLTLYGSLTESEANIATHASSLRVRSGTTKAEKAWVNFEATETIRKVVS